MSCTYSSVFPEPVIPCNKAIGFSLNPSSISFRAIACTGVKGLKATWSFSFETKRSICSFTLRKTPFFSNVVNAEELAFIFSNWFFGMACVNPPISIANLMAINSASTCFSAPGLAAN